MGATSDQKPGTTDLSSLRRSSAGRDCRPLPADGTDGGHGLISGPFLSQHDHPSLAQNQSGFLRIAATSFEGHPSSRNPRHLRSFGTLISERITGQVFGLPERFFGCC